MNKLVLNLIFSIIMLPVNLCCSFWIFKEALNLTGTTFKEMQNHFAQTIIPSGRNGMRKKQRRIFLYLAERTSQPEKIRKILRWYGISTLPGLAALILAEYGATSRQVDSGEYVFIGNLILVLINTILVIVGKLYRNNHPLDEKTAEILAVKRAKEREESSKHRVKNVIVYTLIGSFFLAVLVGFNLAAGGIVDAQTSKTQSVTNVKKITFSDVHDVLYEKGFETANIPSTYWTFDESKLLNVAVGIKKDIRFEFYEYSDGETTQDVCNKILEDILKDAKSDKSSQHETPLLGGGKMFTVTKDGVCNFVLYQRNTVIYAYSSEDSKEIQDILSEIGYVEEE